MSLDDTSSVCLCLSRPPPPLWTRPPPPPSGHVLRGYVSHLSLSLPPLPRRQALRDWSWPICCCSVPQLNTLGGTRYMQLYTDKINAIHRVRALLVWPFLLPRQMFSRTPCLESWLHFCVDYGCCYATVSWLKIIPRVTTQRLTTF